MPLVRKSLFAPREKVGIFISYRRADTAGHAGRLVDQLKSRFGDQVFFDVDSIKPGANFHQVIEETFTKCGAVVVLIGKRWLERDAGMPSQMRAGRFRYSYSLAGRQMEEDIYCVLSYTSAPAVQSVYWSPEQLYSIRAERSELDQKTKLMQAIVSSIRINLQCTTPIYRSGRCGKRM